MKTFLAVYTGTPEKRGAWDELSPAARAEREQAGMKAWGEWVEAHRDSIVDMGAPLGTTKLVGPNGITDIHNALAAYTVVRAANHQAAAQLFLNHPHFMIFPGEGVEIMECLPLPGQ